MLAWPTNTLSLWGSSSYSRILEKDDCNIDAYQILAVHELAREGNMTTVSSFKTQELGLETSTACGGVALSASIPRASEGAPWISALSLPPHLPIRRRSGGLLWFALWAGSEVDSGSALCYLCEPGQVHPEKPQAPHS